MRMLKIDDSSNIAGVGYDPEAAKLRVLFRSGGLYEYSNVPHQEFFALANADSVGKELDKRVKRYPETYPYKKIEDRLKPGDAIEATVRLKATVLEVSSSAHGLAYKVQLEAAEYGAPEMRQVWLEGRELGDRRV